MTSTMTKKPVESYSVYKGISELKRIRLSTSIAFDTETLQIQPEKGKLRLIQLGCNLTKTIVVIDCFDLSLDDWDVLKHFFHSINRFWLAHNAVFDLGWLQEHDIYPKGAVKCSFLANRLLYNGISEIKHGLDAVAKKHLNIIVSKEQQKSDWGAEALSTEQLTYAAKDVEILLRLDSVLNSKIFKADLFKAYDLECKVLPAMAQMWRVGLPWDIKQLEQCRIDYEDDIKELGNEFLRELDNDLPPGEKLPRNEDGSHFNKIYT